MDLPAVYKSRAVRIEFFQRGKARTKGFSTESLYLKMSQSQISIFGMHAGKSICKKIAVERIVQDTFYVRTGIREIDRKQLCFYSRGDTLLGNYNFLDASYADSAFVKILLEKSSVTDNELRRICNE